MSVVVPFVGRAERSAQENLSAYIEYARSHTPLINVDWDADAWDLTEYVKKRNRGRTESWAHFASWRDSSGNKKDKNDYLREPFKSFAKATLSEILRRFRVSEYRRFLYAMRALEHALLRRLEKPCITVVTGADFDSAADLLRDRYKDPWNVGRCLERLAMELIEPATITSNYLTWKSPFKWQRPTRNDQVYQDNRATVRLPDPRAVIALGEIFHDSDNAADVVASSFAALAMFAPNRASEILSLPVDCITEAQGGDTTLMGLRWQPAKGGTPITKFAASPESEAVARESVLRLKEMGETVRRVARWYAEHPDELYLPSGFEHLRNKLLTAWEITQIIGRDSVPPAYVLSHYFGFKPSGEQTQDPLRMAPGSSGDPVKLWRFSEVERWVLGKLPKNFPILDSATNLKWDKALFVLPTHIMRPDVDTLRYLPSPVSIHMINHQLGANPGGVTVFSRNGKVDADQRPWKVTSHQFRHLLNTLAQSKYLSQELIAFWSGRKSVAQNEWYDHIPQEAFIEAYLKLDTGAPELNVVGALDDKARETTEKVGLTYKEALNIELGAIQTTRYGLCRHDYAMSPCPKDKDCINCGESVFVKGDDRQLTEANAQYNLYRKAMKSCETAIEQGQPGAQAWLTRHAERLTRWSTLLSKLTDPNIADGTLISLPPTSSPQTRTGLAVEAASMADKSDLGGIETILDEDFFK